MTPRARRAAAALTAIAALTLTTACGNSGAAGVDSKPKPPAHEIVERDDRGNTSYITIEVDTTKNLKAVFDAVAAQYTNEGGYFIYINCSTGNTETFENRLAVGKKAVGSIGSATTGLEDGSTNFEKLADRTCP